MTDCGILVKAKKSPVSFILHAIALRAFPAPLGLLLMSHTVIVEPKKIPLRATFSGKFLSSGTGLQH